MEREREKRQIEKKEMRDRHCGACGRQKIREMQAESLDLKASTVSD